MLSASRQTGICSLRPSTAASLCLSFFFALFCMTALRTANAQMPAPGNGPIIGTSLQEAYILLPADASDGLLHGKDHGIYSSRLPNGGIWAHMTIESVNAGGASQTVSTWVDVGNSTTVDIDLQIDTSLLPPGDYVVHFWAEGATNHGAGTDTGDQSLWNLSDPLTIH